jgi:hypothetical protein
MDSQRGQRGHDFLPPHEALSKIPGAYGSESVPAEDKTIWLHYFSVATDHYLAEVWHEPGEQDGPAQWMGFGYARLAAFPQGAEWGYVNLDELEQLRAETPDGLPVIVERDLNWEPKKFSEVREAQEGTELADRHERAIEAAREGERTVTLDPEQAATIIAALEDATVLRREAIGYCPEFSTHASTGPCADHKGSWETADKYDTLRWQLEADAGDPDDPWLDERAAEESEPPQVPDTAEAVSPEVANTIGDYARAANRLEFGLDGQRYASEAEAEAWGTREPSRSHAEWLAEGQADPGPTERRLEEWNKDDAHADSLEADQLEAGE